MPKTSKPVKTPPHRDPVQGGYEQDWDLTEVPDAYLTAELVRRGYRTALIKVPVEPKGVIQAKSEGLKPARKNKG